ncbi:hypothetical protein GCM10027343_19780 [Noviherbaspirillum agri]
MTVLITAESPRRQEGLTMVELVVTLIIVGILAAFVVPRFFGTHGFEERGLYDETVAALRYAQKNAIASRRMVCVTFTEQTVSLRIAAANPATPANCSGAAGMDLAGPDGTSPYRIDTMAEGNTKYRNANIKFKNFNGGGFPATLTFDPLGRPNAGATIEVADFATGIRVEAETGYVH